MSGTLVLDFYIKPASFLYSAVAFPRSPWTKPALPAVFKLNFCLLVDLGSVVAMEGRLGKSTQQVKE